IVCFSYSTDAAPTARDTLSLHDALPIYTGVKLTREQIMVAEAMIQRGVSIRHMAKQFGVREGALRYRLRQLAEGERPDGRSRQRSEEHTSELQSRENLVCRLLLEKKKYR